MTLWSSYSSSELEATNCFGASQMAQTVKNPPAMWKTWVLSLSQEDPLEKVMATHASILTWRIPWVEEPGELQCMGLWRVRHNWATNTSFFYLFLELIILSLWTQSSAQFSSVQFSCSVRSDFLPPHESQHARPPYPSPTPRVHSNSHPLSRWCHQAISSSVVPFSSCLQSLPASESFPMSQLFAWGGQRTGVSASASFFLKNTQVWSPLFFFLI